MWAGAGNISEAAYVLSMMYFPFIFLHRTSSLSVCQIMCQILEVTKREKNRQTYKEADEAKEREERGGNSCYQVLMKW